MPLAEGASIELIARVSLTFLDDLEPYIPVAGDVVRRESDQREDRLRRAAFHPDTFDYLTYHSWRICTGHASNYMAVRERLASCERAYRPAGYGP